MKYGFLNRKIAVSPRLLVSRRHRVIGDIDFGETQLKLCADEMLSDGAFFLVRPRRQQNIANQQRSRPIGNVNEFDSFANKNFSDFL